MDKTMDVFITWLTDVVGNRYLGIKYPSGTLSKYTDIWKDSFEDKELLEDMLLNKHSRDGDMHHTTVINVMEFKKLLNDEVITTKSVEKFLGKKIQITLKGIGKAEDLEKGNITNFIVIESEQLQEVRKSIGLNPYEFHITLGFDKKDVFGRSKSDDSIFIEF